MELVSCSLSNLVDLCDIENLDTRKGKLCKDVTCSGCHSSRKGVKAQLNYTVGHSKETSQKHEVHGVFVRVHVLHPTPPPLPSFSMLVPQEYLGFNFLKIIVE